MEVSGRVHNSVALPPGNTIRIHGREDWLGPRSVMDFLEQNNLSSCYRNSNRGPSSP